jgi:hypothetical protein
MADPNLWQSLVATALIGTERQADLPQVDGSPIGELMAQLPGGNAETSLLNRAAALALYCKAGQKPLTVSATGPIACEPDDVPVCPQSALVYLRQTLSGDRRAQLSECLRLIAEAGWRMPERLLPQVLELGRKQPELRPVITPIWGKRGLWLAQQLPDGNDAIATTDSGDWETGTRSRRIRYLEQTRLVDPALARTQLEDAFNRENAKDRALFLKTLKVGLSDADLVFLEKGLTDRSQEVQQVAIALLTQLPASSLCQKAIAVLRTAIVDDRSSSSFDITPPKKLDADIQALKLAPISTAKQLGKSAVELAHLISWVPLSSWSEQLGVGIPELLERTTQSHWRDAIVIGLINATMNQKNAIVAAELLAAIPEEASRLMGLLTAAQAHELVLQLDQQGKQEQVWRWLRESEHVWNQSVTELAIRLTAEKLKSTRERWTIVQWLDDSFANRVDLSNGKAIALLQNLETDDHYVQAQLVQLCQTIQFRQEMLQALQTESG